MNLRIPFIIDNSLDLELQNELLKFGFEFINRNESSSFKTYIETKTTRIEYSDKLMTLCAGSGLKLQIDFRDRRYQRKFSPSSDLLCRACGWHLGFRRVWDLTAGLAVDSMILTQAGFKVTAFERNPCLAAMLKDALRNYLQFIKENQESGILTNYNNNSNITFIWSEAEQYLTQSMKVENPSIELPEVIYYDPMYPEKNKTALPSKEMQILREINGINEESSDILKKAIKLGVKRVVVKRPLKSKSIIENPKFQLKSKLIRFDIY